MGGLIVAILAFRGRLEPILHGQELLMLVTCALGGGAYAVLLLLFRAVTPAEIRSALRRKPGTPPATEV